MSQSHEDITIRSRIGTVIGQKTIPTWGEIYGQIQAEHLPALAGIIFGVSSKTEEVEDEIYRRRLNEVAHDLGFAAEEGHTMEVALEIGRRETTAAFNLPSDFTVAHVCQLLARKRLIKQRALKQDITWDSIALLIVREQLAKLLKLPDDAGFPVINAYLQQHHLALAEASSRELVRAELLQHRELNLPSQGVDWEETINWLVYSEVNGTPIKSFDDFYLLLMVNAVDDPARFA